MKTLRAIPLFVGAISFACIAVQAKENTVEPPTLSATDKIQIIETIEITSEKDIDTSNSNELDKDVAAILDEVEAQANATEGVAETPTVLKKKVDSTKSKTKLVKGVKIDSSDASKKVKLKADSMLPEGKIKLKKSKNVEIKQNLD